MANVMQSTTIIICHDILAIVLYAELIICIAYYVVIVIATLYTIMFHTYVSEISASLSQHHHIIISDAQRS